jgi:hypothetical protein
MKLNLAIEEHFTPGAAPVAHHNPNNDCYDNATITARLQLTIFGKWRAIPNKNSYIIEITSADR